MISLVFNLSLIFSLFLTSCGPVVFPSAESKTADWKTVYNEVSWKNVNGKDIWVMNQSHHGLELPKNKWDQIMIIVDNGTASFHQLQNGLEIPHKATCLNCHSNGPRAIRPETKNNLTLIQKAQIFAMNLRIKTYGPLKTKNIQSDAPKLTLETCTRCHNNNDSFLSRGELSRDQSMTIEYMVKNKIMPPLGSLTAAEKKHLSDYFFK